MKCTCAYAATLLSSEDQIRESAIIAKRSTNDDNPMLDASFFLASVTSAWAPRIVAIRENENVVGLVYFKERKLLGRATGILFGDSSLGTAYLGDRRLQREAFRLSVEALLANPKTRGVRLKIPTDGPEFDAIHEVIAAQAVDASHWRIADHARLKLPGDYQEFLKALGYTARRNFRYYCRKSDAAGHRYEEHLSVEELRSACYSLLSRTRKKTKRREVNRLLHALSATSRRWTAGLKDSDGRWISVAAGSYLGSQPIMFIQLNDDRGFKQFSLSVVLRGHLIRRFIGEGAAELIFWAGAGWLNRYCTYAPSMAISLDKQQPGWRFTRRLTSLLAQWMPSALAQDLWFVAGTGSAVPIARLPQIGAVLAIGCQVLDTL